MGKLITLKFGNMTSTVVFPVLKSGRLLQATAFTSGEGQISGRFPVVFAVATDDAEVDTQRVGRGEVSGFETRRVRLVKAGRMPSLKSPDPDPPRLQAGPDGAPVRIILFRDAAKAETVAASWAKGGAA